jgi:cytochrome c oxidase subunit 4
MNIHATVRTYSTIYVLLMALLAITVAAAYYNLGPLNLFIALGIAGVKSLLVVLYFMHARRSGPLIALTACASLVWLGILLGLSYADYSSRAW